MKRPTIADIARVAGVSKGAVSYALNGQPGVSDATRERILAIAQRLGFNPNNAARALSRASARTVGLALCRPARVLGLEPFFMELISGVEAELSARSYALTLQVVADPDAEISTYRRWWGERRVDGAATHRPTAVVYDNDIMAIAGLGVAQEMGLSVPADISIVAWDDSALCRLVHPPLTALGRDIAAHGAHAARRLLRVIDGESVDGFQDETARLNPRGSTAPPHLTVR